MLLALLVLGVLALGSAGGGYYWWRHRDASSGDPSSQPASPTSTSISPEQRPVCSDDDDPKYLEQLEYGPAIEVAFDRKHLDALADRPIEPEEIYPWQPEGLVAVLGEHRMRGSVVTASPDGKLVAVASAGSPFIRVGPTDNLHEKTILTVPRGVYSLAWSPSGNLLAASCADGNTRLFSVESLEKIPQPTVLEKAAAPVRSLSWSGDAKYLLGGDRTLRAGVAWVWEVPTRKIVQKLLHESSVMDVAFSTVAGDYRALTAGGTEDGQVYLWDAVAGKELARVDFRPSKTDTTTYVASVAMAPDGKKGLSCHPDGTTRVWDLSNLTKGQEAQVIKLGTRTAPLAVFTPDGQRIVSASPETREIRLHPSSGAGKPQTLAKSRQVHALLPLAEGDRLLFSATLGQSTNVHVIEMPGGKEIRPPQGHLSGVVCVALAPDGASLASGGADYVIRGWDLEKGKERHASALSQVRGVGFTPDGKRILGWGIGSGALHQLGTQSGKPEGASFQGGHGGGISSAAITRDGRYAVTGGRDGSVRMWRLQDGLQMRYFDGAGEGVPTITLCPDMRRVMRTGSKRTQLLHLRCQETIFDWTPPVWAPFLPDGRALLIGRSDTPVVKVADPGPEETERLPLKIPGLTRGDLSPDGRRVAAIAGGNVLVLDVQLGKQGWKWTVPPHLGDVYDVALSSDGGHLATANGDGTVYVIRLP